MKLIDKLRGMADEAVETVQWPFRKRMIERSAASFVDASESERLKVGAQIIEKERQLTRIKDEVEGRAIFKEIINLRLELEEANHIAKLAAEEKTKLFDTEEE